MDEEYLLLLLADSNLPTGSFVASSGLESYLKHGFSSSSAESTIVAFITDSLASYARSTLPFVSDAHHLVALAREQRRGEGELNEVLKDLMELDHLYNSMTLNHVARRASKAQGVALLTLYSKGFARPSSLSALTDSEPHHHETAMNRLFSQFKLSVRKEEVDGHLPTCWGALTAALGLALDRAQYLHLFLHARSLLSASVRLNDIGPYGAQQILLHVLRPLITAEAERCHELRTELFQTKETGFDVTIQGPANTWPLGEILASRHDLQHSRIFNS